MYSALLAQGVALSPKPFALGFRVEHPQALIDSIQYGQEYAAGGSHVCAQVASTTLWTLLTVPAHAVYIQT